MASNSPGGEDCPLLCARGWGMERQVKKPPACAWRGDMITGRNLNNALYCITTPALTFFHGSLFRSHPPRPTLFVSVHPALRSQVIFNRET